MSIGYLDKVKKLECLIVDCGKVDNNIVLNILLLSPKKACDQTDIGYSLGLIMGWEKKKG
jgi:hypothetical protein